jgi:hypothetical protein
MSTTAAPQRKTTPPTVGRPVLKVTRYDLVTSTLIATVIGLAFTFCSLTAVWITNRLSKPDPSVPLELLEMPGGFEDGAIDETLKLESPEDVVNDPSLADAPAEENEIEEMLENVVELADQATNQTSQTFELATRNVGNPGSATGTGRRALGIGPGEAGLPREQRWFVHFSRRGTLNDYAKQLDHFGIELGALVDGQKIVYLSKMAENRPQTRSRNTGAGENRLYMTWQGGTRQRADLQIFRKANINVGAGTIFHFYPPKIESMLARLERDFKNKPVTQIRRTYFIVRLNNGAYEFLVSRQIYFE